MKNVYVAPAFDLNRLPTVEGERTDPGLGTLAHDLNNKLSVIVANCDMLLTGERALDEEMAQRILQIKAAAVSMANQIQKRQCPLGSADEAKTAGA
jgi:hypothetical protein